MILAIEEYVPNFVILIIDCIIIIMLYCTIFSPPIIVLISCGKPPAIQ